MPSRPLLPPPSPPPFNHHHHHLLPIILTLSITLLFIILLTTLLLIYRKLSRNRTVTAPSDLKSPNNQNCRRFSYKLLRRATSSFSPSNRLGRGGFGSVYKAVIPSSCESVAVKLMDPNGSLQGEGEFHNELSLASSLSSPHVLSLLGFSSDRRRRRLMLVYELMENRSLQDALLDRKCPELMAWSKRFCVAIDVARGLEYLHHFRYPPVIHGDIKPSNILLDVEFKAKIGDFGLARLKTEDQVVEERNANAAVEDNGSILEEEVESVSVAARSPESSVIRVVDSDLSPETIALSPEVVGIDKGSVSDQAGFDKVSVESGIDLSGNRKGGSRRNWWWKQDNGNDSGSVKDYVMDWIGSEIKKERPNNEWIVSQSVAEMNQLNSKERVRKKDKNRKPREWWKEEFCEELAKKKSKKRSGTNSSNGGESWWHKDEVQERNKNKKRKNKSGRGSIDWWLDGFSGELRNGRKNSQDWASGDIPKSGGVSSTPSMRGTVCYIAPECGGGVGGGLISEKCDVYSFGVLLLVIVSGRRPLQVTASPMSEFERANLISWAKQLAFNGKLLDLVDPSIHSLDKDQALLCITIALLCLQRSPSKRPSMKEIVGMLSGEAEPPHLPFEFSPSPPSNFPFKSRTNGR
ncbi:Pkinase domain-containing protein/Pkinase_Tyr domain-containing protein [Cephalotus follicularis]|uniref:non-specific serine/threonine protein kinase n=1 Tax=Cephalotus follicularis TaxID=3775 RepID=A0A1Q3C8S5_CEPFO|nr:Pkinase domain-containing protein/Pkinase_Tyr domain-containing protein [Cephalotus follicularis]